MRRALSQVWRGSAPKKVACSWCTPRRWISQGRHFAAACEGLPTTPTGRNPYDVLELTLHPSLDMNSVSKQYRQLVVRYHPDQPEGSTEKMTEVNLAYKILKEHHERVVSQWQVAQTRESIGGPSGGGRASSARAAHEEFTRRARRQGPARPAAKPRRPFSEISTHWESLMRETEAAVRSMSSRYELAIEQGKFLRSTKSMNEITARERWLRKSFIKGLWENVHELRGELLHRGSRSAQQSELSESMIVFGSQIQRKLNEDFQQQTQKSVLAQTHVFLERGLMIVLSMILLVRFWKWAFDHSIRKMLFSRAQRPGVTGE